MLEINKSVSAAKDVKPNVNDDAASAISREEIAAILTVKQGSLSYDGAAIEYYNFIIRHKQAVKFIKDPSTKLSNLLDSLTGRAAMIVGGCSLLGDDGYGEALDPLEHQFGNKEKIFGLIEKDLLEGKQVKSGDQLLTFACVLRGAVTSMKGLSELREMHQTRSTASVMSQGTPRRCIMLRVQSHTRLSPARLHHVRLSRAQQSQVRMFREQMSHAHARSVPFVGAHIKYHTVNNF